MDQEKEGIRMNKKNIEKHFSPMAWLDEEIARNQASPGRNERSDRYCAALQTIKDKQSRGEIPSDEDYLALGGIRKNRTHCHNIEYGYYMANIHYDLFHYDLSDKDSLEDRILYFIEHAELDENAKDNFFLNFPANFSYYLSHIYKTDVLRHDNKRALNKSREDKLSCLYDAFCMRRLVDMIERYGNDKEKLILGRLFEMI